MNSQSGANQCGLVLVCDSQSLKEELRAAQRDGKRGYNTSGGILKFYQSVLHNTTNSARIQRVTRSLIGFFIRFFKELFG